MKDIIKNLITDLRALQFFKLFKDDQQVRRHSIALLKRLQEISPQDEEETCRNCEETHTDGIMHMCPENR